MIVCKWVWFILMFAVLQEESGAKSQTGEKTVGHIAHAFPTHPVL